VLHIYQFLKFVNCCKCLQILKHTTLVHNCVKLQWCTKTGKKVMAFDIHVPIGAYGLYMSNITYLVKDLKLVEMKWIWQRTYHQYVL